MPNESALATGTVERVGENNSPMSYTIRNRPSEAQSLDTSAGYESCISKMLAIFLDSQNRLIEDIDDLDADMRHRYLSIINDESDRLGRLINDVLDLQKIDSGKMSWHMFILSLISLLPPDPQDTEIKIHTYCYQLVCPKCHAQIVVDHI